MVDRIRRLVLRLRLSLGDVAGRHRQDAAARAHQLAEAERRIRRAEDDAFGMGERRGDV
jgi:hypothetical protein